MAHHLLAGPALALALVGPVAAQQPPAASPGDAGQPISRQQFIAEMDAEFARIDADGDGIVTQAEIAASDRAAATREALRQNRLVFDQLDTDRNGLLSPEEFAQLANPDAVTTGRGNVLATFDTDGDGVVTLLEYRIGTQGNFDRIDSDRDGVVTPAEMGAGPAPR